MDQYFQEKEEMFDGVGYVVARSLDEVDPKKMAERRILTKRVSVVSKVYGRLVMTDQQSNAFT